jgi:DNA polymerase V
MSQKNQLHRSAPASQNISTISHYPMLDTPVPAGFPAPASDISSVRIDLNAQLIKQADATFMVRVVGDSMIEFGIHDSDTLIVDRSVTPADKHIVLAVVNGEFTIKQLRRFPDQVLLRAGNSDYADILIENEEDLGIWGVVRWSLHPLIGTNPG